MSKKDGAWCSATGCKNNFRTSQTSFYKFPKDPARWLIWVHAIGRLDLLNKGPEYANVNCKLCSDHFEESAYLNDLKTRLMPTAIPTLRLRGILIEVRNEIATPTNLIRSTDEVIPSTSRSTSSVVTDATTKCTDIRVSSEPEMLDAAPNLSDPTPNILDIEMCTISTGVQTPPSISSDTRRERKLRHDLRSERAKVARLTKHSETKNSDPVTDLTISDFQRACQKFLPQPFADLASQQASLHAMRGQRYSNELKKKLYPGVKDSMSAMDRLEAYNTNKAITLTITTRAIGFATVHIFASLFEFNNVPVRGSIYQLYRVGLAIIEAKVQFTQRGVSMIMNNVDDYKHNTLNEEWMQAAKAVGVMPDQISTIVNAIGKVTVYDPTYVPKLASDNYTDEIFVPQSEQVVLTNLRDVVVALSDGNTPMHQRRAFYQHNPIPGAIWNGNPENPILQNPDDIMPADYQVVDLQDDINDLRAKMTFLNKKAGKYFTKPISFEPDGQKTQLICNKQEGIKVCDRGVREGLEEYYNRCKIEGDIDDYYNLTSLSAPEQLEGNLLSLGECPIARNRKYLTYLLRDERACVEFSNLHYKAARNMRYT